MPLPYDGIIGLDLLINKKCKLIVENSVLELKIANEQKEIKFTKAIINYLQPDCIYEIVKIPLIMQQDQILLKSETSISKRPVTYLIDSGSSVSLIDGKLLKNGTPISRSNTIKLKSATGHSAQSIALTTAQLLLENAEIGQTFHVFDQSMPLSYDGILGWDFIFNNLCIIDFDSGYIEIKIPINLQNQIHPTKSTSTKKIFEVPEKVFNSSINVKNVQTQSEVQNYLSGLSSSETKTTTVPEMSTKSISISTTLEDGCYVINNFKILPHVSTPDTLIEVKNNRTIIPVINHNNFPVKINHNTLKAKVNIEKLSGYHIFTLVKENGETERVKYVRNRVALEHCDIEIKNTLTCLLEKYNDCFFIEGDTVNHTDITVHKIDLLPNAKPVYVKQYRIPVSQQAELQRQLETLEQQKVIEKCSASGWNSPIILVPKTDENGEKKKSRLVVDFRRVNECTVPLQFPIPSLDSIVDQLAHSTIFSTLDLHGAFYQIQLDEPSRSITTFQNNNFSYRFLSMPMGLKTSPATLQSAVNIIFKDMLNKGVNIYFDDILVYSKDIESHLCLLESVLKLLRRHSFKLKIEKCKFLQPKVEYLGHIIDKNGSLPNPAKTDCISKYPKPKNVIETQRFLGLCNYYRKFVKQYAQTAKPLYCLIKKDSIFNWNDACDVAFETLKSALINPPVLSFPDFNRKFIVTTDSSDKAVGAVLSQGEIPLDKPIQFASKVLNPAQQNYSTIEKELYAIVFAVEAFKHFLYGFEFILYTDHKPLTYLFNFKNTRSRLYRWKLLLSEFNFQIFYKKGSHNTVADALSRIDISQLSPCDTTNLMAITRSKSKEIQNSLQELPTENKIDEVVSRQTSPDFFQIEENNDLFSDISQTDHVFNIFPSANCEMKKKLEHRLKTNIKMPEHALPCTPHELNTDHTIYILPLTMRESDRILNIKMVLNGILSSCQDNNYAEIAINIDIREAKHYFEFKSIFQSIFNGSQITPKFYLNKTIDIHDIDHIMEILNTYHNSPLAGHTSYDKTKNAIKRYYNWPTMNQDIKQFVKNCEICKKAKITRHTRSPMQITSTSEYPFQKVYIDFVNVEREHVNDYPSIFTCIDELTKYAIAVRAKNNTAILAAKKFVKHVVLKYNIPQSVVSDRGSAFLSQTFAEVTKLFKIKKITTTSYRPNSNIVERFHRTLQQHLVTCVHKNPSSWHEHIDSAVFAYNNAINSATGYSPHELLFGYKIQLPNSIKNSTSPIYNYENYSAQLRHNLSNYWAIAKQTIEQRKISNKEYRDQHCNPITLNINDQVLMIKPQKEHKFATPYEGPYVVTEIVSPVTVRIKKGNRIFSVHTDKLKKM